MKNGYLDVWDNWSKGRASVPAYDDWLDNYKDVLNKNKNTQVLDLGCGIGADTLYLLERGYDVLSCDFSSEALKSVEENIPNSKTKYLSMMETFPFQDNSYSLIVADLSLHYFDNDTTVHIMKEIKRVLKNDGVLLARVASVEDYNFGAGEGEELEKNFYFNGYYNKRFFNRDDVEKYFGIIGKVDYSETSMVRNEKEYLKPKMLYQIKVEKKEECDEMVVPESVLEYGFDFDWDEEDVWKLDYPTEEIDIGLLDWHFDVPFWNWDNKWYVLKPSEVIDNPEKYVSQYNRVMESDISYPIDVMENKGKLVILDGLHRLVKCRLLGMNKVKVRIIPRSEIKNTLK